MQPLLVSALFVGLELLTSQILEPLLLGHSTGITPVALLIAAAFSMYNRMVEGFRARPPSDLDMYRTRAVQIAEHGYSARPSPTAAGRD